MSNGVYPQPVRATMDWKPTPKERRFILLRIYREAVWQLNAAKIGVIRNP